MNADIATSAKNAAAKTSSVANNLADEVADQSQIVQHLKENLSKGFDSGMEQVGKFKDAATKQANALATRVEDSAKANPALAIIMAAGVGIVVGGLVIKAFQKQSAL